MKPALVALGLASGASGASLSFPEWTAKYGKKYSSVEELQLRRSIYAANVARIEKHNSEDHTWKRGVNGFSDLTIDEFKARYLGGLVPTQQAQRVIGHVNAGRPLEELAGYRAKTDSEAAFEALPASVDWRTAGAVTPVKNQGSCGSCWSFSVTGSVEGVTFLRTGKLSSLSEQQILDCLPFSQGCNGGDMAPTMAWMASSKTALCTEDDYPYIEANHSGDDDGVQGCQSLSSGYCTPPGPPISNYTTVPILSETSLMAAIVGRPTSIGIEADEIVDYASGVYTGQCGLNIDHGVLAVGYGTLDGQDYWTVKNSWGSDWGQAGYFLLGRGPKFNPFGLCGIQLNALYPVMD